MQTAEIIITVLGVVAVTSVVVAHFYHKYKRK